jgi:hypothetical protein
VRTATYCLTAILIIVYVGLNGIVVVNIQCSTDNREWRKKNLFSKILQLTVLNLKFKYFNSVPDFRCQDKYLLAVSILFHHSVGICIKCQSKRSF